MPISWDKSLWRGNSLRRTFLAWKIPQEIKTQYFVTDGDRLSVTIQMGNYTHRGNFKVSSGGELQVDRNTANQIEAYAQGPDVTTIKFITSDFPRTLSDISRIVGKVIPETTRDALIAARIGQGPFRQGLFNKYGGRCAVTGIDVPELLRASHIKPWRASSDEERLHPENGLLLIANLDAAFDAGLMSFLNNGQILFSSRLGPNPHGVLRIPKNSKITQQPSLRQQGFLQIHRRASGL